MVIATTEPTQAERPKIHYLDWWIRNAGGLAGDARWRGVECWGFAIPNNDALEAISGLNVPILEVGAGCAYWASLLKDRGTDIICTDPDPYSCVRMSTRPREYMPVEPLSAQQAIHRHGAGRSLMIIWPSLAGEYSLGNIGEGGWSGSALKSFTEAPLGGDYVIYVGESQGGCTGSQLFHEILGDRTKWQEDSFVGIPRWYGIRDYLAIYKRVR